MIKIIRLEKPIIPNVILLKNIKFLTFQVIFLKLNNYIFFFLN